MSIQIEYPLIVVGAGPAGLAASIYASRYKISHIILDDKPGGQVMMLGDKTVENYPGLSSIPASELIGRFLEQAKGYGVQVAPEAIKGIKKTESGFELVTEKNGYRAKAVILAMGASHRKLGVPGEDNLFGKGVSYCITCDAPLYKNKKVAIIGGGDSAIAGAIHLSAFAEKIYVIHRRNEYRAEPLWVERMRQNNKIEEVLSTQIREIRGTDKVEAVVLDNPHNGSDTLAVDGVFIEVGQMPVSALVQPLGVEVNELGFIVVSPNMETTVPGIFSAGDLSVIRGERQFRQIITATADGVRAAAAVYHYLNQKEPAPSWH